MSVNPNMVELLNMIVANHFRLNMEAPDILETITFWYAHACNTLHTMIDSPQGEKYAEAAKPEIRGNHDELGHEGQPIADQGRQADAPVAELQ